MQHTARALLALKSKGGKIEKIKHRKERGIPKAHAAELCYQNPVSK
jgi:hypothetical protein